MGENKGKIIVINQGF